MCNFCDAMSEYEIHEEFMRIHEALKTATDRDERIQLRLDLAKLSRAMDHPHAGH